VFQKESSGTMSRGLVTRTKQRRYYHVLSDVEETDEIRIADALNDHLAEMYG